MALAGTAFSAFLLVLTAMHAGPLWRDEVNTINLAQMPSLKELWNNLPFESFPPLWPLLLRGYVFLGLAGSDAGIRLLGLYVGLFFLGSLWLCSRWMGCRAPILSLALLGGLPAMIFIVGANRAYGLASGLLVLSFGTIWRMVELPSRSRIFWAGLACLLFVQCVYYDVVFLCAMLAGAALVVIRQRQWPTLGALVGIGAVSGASLAVYLPIIHRSSVYAQMHQLPFFNFMGLWHKLNSTLAAQSSARPPQYEGPEVWLWVMLLLAGSVVALLLQRACKHQASNHEAAAVTTARTRADLALFCAASMLLGTVGLLAFLMKLQYMTQTWYYVEMLCLCTMALDGILGAIRPALRPWGWLRIGFMVLLMTGGSMAAWEEAHTRRSNVDLIATFLGTNASERDLIVVLDAWDGITFDRYYHGRAHWVTVPPIDSHKVHRSDLILEKMRQQDPMAPVLREITATLRSGNSVWTVGYNMAEVPQQLLPPPDPKIQYRLLPYLYHWCVQITVLLQDHALQKEIPKIHANQPVNGLENLPVARFLGYKPNAN